MKLKRRWTSAGSRALGRVLAPNYAPTSWGRPHILGFSGPQLSTIGHINRGPIKLGLERMETLYPPRSPTWKAIHVAGTNGKGSICAYISKILELYGIQYGRFTSPYSLHPTDSIRLNNNPISDREFRDYAEYYTRLAQSLGVQPTPFELMTLIAFRFFDRAYGDESMEYAVVEVGLGGRLDSTNVVTNKAVTVISKLGLDHKEYLGESIEEIAWEKAGIINRAPCIVDGSNDASPLDVIRKKAGKVGAPLHSTTDSPCFMAELQELARQHDLADHEVQNMACAIQACLHGLPDKSFPSLRDLVPQLASTRLPGRLQLFDVSGMLHCHAAKVLLDGAHNILGAQALNASVQSRYRQFRLPVTWIIALGQPREYQAKEYLRTLLRDGDTVIITRYSRQDPPSMAVADLAGLLDSLRPEEGGLLQNVKVHITPDGIGAAMEMLRDKDAARSVVVTGSLYLVSDFIAWYNNQSVSIP